MNWDDRGTGPQAAFLHEIADGAYAWVQPDGTWWVNNAGALHGQDGTIVIDTCATDVRTRRFLAAVAAATGGAPVRMAVNTHHHGDHAYGNSLLPAETLLIGHTRMREELLADPIIDGCPPAWSPRPDWGQVTRRVPQLTFDTRLILHAGSRRVELHHPGYRAHTAGDVVAWLPDERLLYAGDLIFHGLTPLVLMGSVPGALRALDWLADFGAAHLVPGHGPLATGSDLPGILAAHERYYRFVLQVAQDGIRQGLPPLAAASQTDLGEFAGWADAERIVLNLHRAYADAAGGEPDVMAAFTDAVSYRGDFLPTTV